MTVLVGIVNLTPDSFSDGGQWTNASAALAHIDVLLAQGARVIDLGAESTRPGATPLTSQEEWQRLEPVLPQAVISCRQAGARLSVDTRHAQTATRALSLGADWINDVSGMENDAMLHAVAASECMLVLMHSLSIPADPARHLPVDTNPVEAMLEWVRKKVALLEKQGIARQRLIFDPGIGFGKTAEQSLVLIKACGKMKDALQLPLLIGHSRKSFLRLFTDAPAQERDEETLAVSAWLALQGVDYLRVHEVARHRRMLTVMERLER